MGVARFWLMALLAAALPALAHAAVLSPVLDGVVWGEGSTALAQSFGARAIRLAHPIEFGDSYVDVALRGQKIGGYDFSVLFQMDKATQRLKRVMFERQRHGVNPMVFRAVRDALVADYGPAACARPDATIWQQGGVTIRAVFHDTTLEAAEGCTGAGNGPCGTTGQLYVQVVPATPGANPCAGRG
jgi:hypothetical protein